ncbi:WGR domain-containing protein [Brucella intermedia]|nr:WGR domain-containing protein [Brucella intermedia]
MEKNASPVHLRRIDRDRNMARYYRISVDTALFGLMAVTREWGRIGRSGQSRIDLYPDVAEASAAATALLRAKIHRGYFPTDGS